MAKDILTRKGLKAREKEVLQCLNKLANLLQKRPLREDVEIKLGEGNHFLTRCTLLAVGNGLVEESYDTDPDFYSGSDRKRLRRGRLMATAQRYRKVLDPKRINRVIMRVAKN